MRRLTPKSWLGIVGLAHLAYLYAYGLQYWTLPTVAGAFVWIVVVLHFWREEKP